MTKIKIVGALCAFLFSMLQVSPASAGAFESKLTTPAFVLPGVHEFEPPTTTYTREKPTYTHVNMWRSTELKKTGVGVRVEVVDRARTYEFDRPYTVVETVYVPEITRQVQYMVTETVQPPRSYYVPPVTRLVTYQSQPASPAVYENRQGACIERYRGVCYAYATVRVLVSPAKPAQWSTRTVTVRVGYWEHIPAQTRTEWRCCKTEVVERAMVYTVNVTKHERVVVNVPEVRREVKYDIIELVTTDSYTQCPTNSLGDNCDGHNVSGKEFVSHRDVENSPVITAVLTQGQPKVHVVTETTLPPVVTETTLPPVVTQTTLPPVVTQTTLPPVVTPTTLPPVVTQTTLPPVVTPTTTPRNIKPS